MFGFLAESFFSETAMFKKDPQQCLHINLCSISWPLDSHITISVAVKTADNIEQVPDDPKQADEGDIIWVTALISCNKKINGMKLGQYRYRLIIRNIG